MKRVALPIAILLSCFAPVFLPAAAAQKPKTNKKPAASKTVKTTAGQTGTPGKPDKPSAADRARALIPGLGGAPIRKTKPPMMDPGSLIPLSPPGVPLLNNTFPAPVNPQGLPGINGQNPNIPGGLQVRPVSPLLYGVDVAWGDNGGLANWDKDNGAKARRLAQLLRAAGVTNVRFNIRWSEIEKTRGKYDWAATDRFVAFLLTVGVTPVCVVSGTPDWALSPGALPLFQQRGMANLASMRAPDPKFYPDLGRFALACALRYKTKINRWEFWNEPDAAGMPTVVNDAAGKPADIRMGGSPKVYAAMLAVFSKNVRQADAASMIAIGGLRERNTSFLSALYAAGAKPYFDAVALHPSVERDVIAFDWIDRCREVVTKSGDAVKPIWITEWGWRTAPGDPTGVSELQQARLIKETLSGLRERPFINLACYRALNDWRMNEKDPKSTVTTGLIGTNLAPKPGYFAFKEMALGAPDVAPRTFARANLTGALPQAGEGGVRASVVSVTVDADKPGVPIPALWENYSQGVESGGPEFLKDLDTRLKAVGAKLVRFDPFPSPDQVRREGVRIESGAVNASVEAAAARRADLRIDWRYSDEVLDMLSRAGAKPVMNFATMPSSLSSPTGNTRMPRSLEEWGSFVDAVVRRYNGDQKRGIAYWELSNEPNRGSYTLSEWLPLYETFARAVLAADPKARIGGPSTADFGEDWLKTFIDHCGRNGVPLHFVSWHSMGRPPAEYARQVGSIREHLQRYPALKDAELFLDEWAVTDAPSPINDTQAGASRALTTLEGLMEAGPVRPFLYEIKEGRNFRAMDQRLSGKWGMLTWDNKPKPIFNAFRLLSRVGGSRLPAASDEAGIHTLASRDADKVSLLVWSDARLSGGGESRSDVPVRVRISGLPWNGPSRGAQWMVEGSGTPSLAELGSPARFKVTGPDVEVPLVISPNGIALVELTPATAPKLDISLETPQYVSYSGAPLSLTATIRNNGTTPQLVKLGIASDDPLLIPPDRARSGAITVAPGETRTFAYSLMTPLSAPDGRRVIRLTATGSPAAVEAGESSATVKLVSPLTLSLDPPRVDVARPGALADSADTTARIRVVAENRAENELRMSVMAGKTAEDLRVPGRRQVSMPFVVTPPSNKPGNYGAPVKIMLPDRTTTMLTALVGVPALCRYAPRKPRINGDLSEWTDAYPLDLEMPTERAGLPYSVTDLSAQAFTMWDEENFYMAVVVTDDVPSDVFAPEVMDRGDSVFFAVDPKRDATLETEGYRPADAEFGMAKAPLGAAIQRFHGIQGGLTGGVTGARVAVERVGTRTIYEASIPWSQLAPLQPRAGGVAGFSILVNDNDGQGRKSIIWAGGLGDRNGKKQPGQFIGLRLVKDPPAKR